MASTLLQLIQQAAGEMGLPVPTTVASNLSQDTSQQLALLNSVGNELQRQYIWQHSVVEYRFTTEYVTQTGTTTTGSPIITGLASTIGLNGTYNVIGTGINTDVYVLTNDSASQVTLTQASTASGTVTLNFCKVKYAYPGDYDRQIDRTHWDKTKHWEMLGPQTPQQWQFLKSGFISTGPRIRYRTSGGYFQIWPAISSAEYLGFEYISSFWVNSTGSFAPDKSAFTVDTDTCSFPDRLMVVGLKLKYFQTKGFDTSALVKEYQMQLDISKANDGGSQTLSMSPRLSQLLISVDQIPDSGYGS